MLVNGASFLCVGFMSLFHTAFSLLSYLLHCLPLHYPSTFLFVLLLAKFFLLGEVSLLLPHLLQVFNLQETLPTSFKTNFSCTQLPPTLFGIHLGSGLSEAVWILENKEDKSRQSHHSFKPPAKNPEKELCGPMSFVRSD